jgi:hypothetical protein
MNNLNNKKLIYFFEAERDFKNKNAIVQSFGGGSSNGMGILLKGDSNISRNIDIIKEGNYKLSIRLKGTIDLNIDNRSYILKSNLSSNLSNDLSDNLELVDTDIIHLRKGNNYLTIMPLNDSFIDVVWLYSADKDQQHLSDIFNGSKESKHDINYSKIDPTKYRLSINSNKPFILAFTDSYNPSWIVRNNESEYNSLPIYSAINSFEINDTGNLDITIEYKPQEWFYYGSYISIFTVIISICYLILRKIKKLRKIKNDI